LLISSQPQASPPKNVGTFAGAIGGSVGALFLLSLGLAVNIYIKRRAARNRTQLPVRDDPSLFTEGPGDRPQTERPSPFIPRYFPDSVHSPPLHTPRGRSCATGHLPTPLPQLRVEARPDPDTHSSVVTDSPVSAHKPGSAIQSPTPSVSSPHLPPGLPEPSLEHPAQECQKYPSLCPPTIQEGPRDMSPMTPPPVISRYHLQRCLSANSTSTSEESPAMQYQTPSDSCPGPGTQVNCEL